MAFKSEKVAVLLPNSIRQEMGPEVVGTMD
jgi:hypothetical protein